MTSDTCLSKCTLLVSLLRPQPVGNRANHQLNIAVKSTHLPLNAAFKLSTRSVTSCGEFVVCRAGRAYDSRDREPQRTFWFNCQTLAYTRRRSEGKRWRKKYVPLSLVYSYRANLGCYREIGDACAHNDVLDDRARHHRIDHRRRRSPHVFDTNKRTISSRRPHFVHTGRDLGSVHLL